MFTLAPISRHQKAFWMERDAGWAGICIVLIKVLGIPRDGKMQNAIN